MTMAKLNCICLDSSSHSEDAFKWYIENIHQPSDVVGLVHVVRTPQLPSIGILGTTDGFDDTKHAADETSVKVLAKYQAICKEKQVTFKVINPHTHRSPGEQICESARDHGASMIVIGQRGLGVVSRAMLGSVSDHVLHNAKLPVLVVPQREDKLSV